MLVGRLGRLGFSARRLQVVERPLSSADSVVVAPPAPEIALVPFAALDSTGRRSAWKLHEMAAREIGRDDGWVFWSRGYEDWRDEVASVAANELPGTITHQVTFVTPHARRRGIASALKRAVFGSAAASGLRAIRACNREEGNASGSLNAALGFHPVDAEAIVALRWKPGGSPRSDTI